MMSDSGLLDPANAEAPDQPVQDDAGEFQRSDMPVGSSMERARQPVYGQGIVVSLVASAFLLVLAILAVREDESVTGVPATETTGPLYWGLAILFTLTIAIGSQYSEWSAARSAAALGHPREPREYPTAWIVPVVGMAGTILLVATLHNTAMFVLGPLLAFFSVGGSLLARDLIDDATDSTYRTASAVHTVVIHIVAFVSLSAVYLNKMSLWAAVPLVAVFSFLLILESLERGEAPLHTRIGYAALGAYLMSLSMVFLNWWQTYGYTGGGVLLVCFYIVNGVLLAQTQRGVVRMKDLIEFAVVGAVALAILIVTM
jgi:nicotinamide riboside transporter PnuC